MISVVIPTRNRPELLSRLLDELDKELPAKSEVIVVDSSDEEKLLEIEKSAKISIIHKLSTIQSAAVQRNIGIEQVSKDCEYLFFLDDDVLPPKGYFEHIKLLCEQDSVVGASGLAQNPASLTARRKPNGLIGFVHLIFLLDSRKDGKLLPSGVNVPVRVPAQSVQECDWLIGCSGWKFTAVRELRFEADFTGQSLGEDVIFSVRAAKYGKLLTDPKLILDHVESPIGRASQSEYWEMWMINRWRLISVMDKGVLGKTSFWWATLGQILIEITSNFLHTKDNDRSILGIFRGMRKIGKFKN